MAKTPCQEQNALRHEVFEVPAITAMVRPGGFEPPTSWTATKRSNPLSYGRIIFMCIALGPRSKVYDKKGGEGGI